MYKQAYSPIGENTNYLHSPEINNTMSQDQTLSLNNTNVSVLKSIYATSIKKKENTDFYSSEIKNNAMPQVVLNQTLSSNHTMTQIVPNHTTSQTLSNNSINRYEYVQPNQKIVIRQASLKKNLLCNETNIIDQFLFDFKKTFYFLFSEVPNNVSFIEMCELDPICFFSVLVNLNKRWTIPYPLFQITSV